MKMSIVDASIPPTGRRLSAIYIAVRYSVHQSDRSNTVSLWCKAEGGRRCIVADEDRQHAVSGFRIRAHRKSRERKINE